MSLGRVLKILETFGLARTDAEVYVYIAKKGPKREDEIAKAVKLTTTQLGPALEKLQKKGFICASLECSTLFSALAFERVINMMIELKDEEAKAVKETREALLSTWQEIIQKKRTS